MDRLTSRARTSGVWTVLERGAVSATLVALFTVGYFGLGLTQHRVGTRGLGTVLDARIPFVADSVWVYLWMFSSAFIPLFVVRCPSLFRRTAIAYTLAITVSLIAFAGWPVTSTNLRATPMMLDPARASDHAVAVIYALDPPRNLFPSLHLSIAALAAWSAWKAARQYGRVLFVCVAVVGVSVCTVKQHFVLDALGGLALAALAGGLTLWPYRPPADGTPAYSWRGPVLYLASLAVVSAGIYLVWLRPH